MQESVILYRIRVGVVMHIIRTIQLRFKSRSNRFAQDSLNCSSSKQTEIYLISHQDVPKHLVFLIDQGEGRPSDRRPSS